jgi:hypothetical protein
MTGKLLINGVEGPHTHGVFELDDARLLYDDIRQFGRIEWSEEIPQRIAALGPEPLEIPVADFVSRLRGRSTKVKPLLLNQSFLAGLGNIYVDEALFRASIHPNTPASRISRVRAAGLHQAIVEILRVAIDHRGSSISDYVDADGQRGGFQALHQAMSDQFVVFGRSQVLGDGLEGHQEADEVVVLVELFDLSQSCFHAMAELEIVQSRGRDRAFEMEVQLRLGECGKKRGGTRPGGHSLNCRLPIADFKLGGNMLWTKYGKKGWRRR